MGSKPSAISFQIKAVIVVFVVLAIAFGYSTYNFYQEGQQKSRVIRAQTEDLEGKLKVIENQTQKISFLDAIVENQTEVISNQSSQITEFNSTIFSQIDIINRQITELRRRLDVINLLEGNVSLLKSDVKAKEQVIVSLTPVIKSFFVAAVTSDGSGAIIPLEVKILPKGSGLLSVNIKNVDLLGGAQESIRLAASVASKLASVTLVDKDIDVSFVNQLANIVTVDGPSAGGAITATIYAALSEKSISRDIMMTGTIQNDGTIGAVGGVQKKAEAAKNQGASRFLVPKTQKVSVTGLEVLEVSNIQEVLNYLVS